MDVKSYHLKIQLPPGNTTLFSQMSNSGNQLYDPQNHDPWHNIELTKQNDPQNHDPWHAQHRINQTKLTHIGCLKCRYETLIMPTKHFTNTFTSNTGYKHNH